MNDHATTGNGSAPQPVEDRSNPYSGRRDMPADFSVSIGEKGGTDRQLLRPPTARTMSMRGFDDHYVDIVDYIVRITHRIWEEKQIGYIYDTYRHNSRVTDDYGLQYGRDKIVADTVHTINAFPDVRLYADEVVWAGDDVSGFHTSHRTVIVGTNTGYSKYGPPTGRRVVVWAIANCVALENEIFEEHVIYNNSSLIQQLGYDLRTKAREFGNQAADLNGLLDRRFGEAERVLGQGKPAHLPALPDDRFDVEAFIRRAYHYIWNWRNIGSVDQAYAAGLRYHGPTGREYYGRGEYKSFVLSLIAMFPDLALTVDDVYHMGNEADGFVTSVRWSAVGTHRGFGVYGRPTGRRVYLWGITQHRIRDGRIQEEWMQFNEFEVLQQIHRDDPFETA
ncbi:nuclear transport factor 2 family protein [Streptosporangium sp. NBC_01756]|uniref:nuclear transport factor 2 family protein n=1 Tax=Streptosporangium sp. NBC_01756 TaxID=2975950 RepID=UPI002DD8CA45|nr:ester cyclase [Streptosporangium sp. NBC_01756]WSC87957.1 ester cyclase [Streptosporangium sp. NBC_01756]